MIHLRLLLVIAANFTLIGCASVVKSVIPQKGYNPSEVATVKSVAIVAFDILQYQPTGVAGRIAGPVGGAVTGAQMTSNAQSLETVLVQDIYSYLSDQLKASRNWRVVGANEIVKNPFYKELSERKKSEFKEAFMATPGQKPYVVPGILRPINPVYQFSAEEVVRLKAALKVDAIVLAEVKMYVQRSSVLGLGVGNGYLYPQFSFYVFNGSAAKQPIWFDYAYDGVPSDKSLGKVHGMEDVHEIEAETPKIIKQAIAAFLKESN